MLEAPLQELRELRGEPKVEPRAGHREFGALGVSGPQFLEVPMELDPEVEHQSPEKGHGSDRSLPPHKAGLASELFDRLRREKLVQRPLHLPPTKRCGPHGGLGMLRHPIEVPRAGKRPPVREETVSRGAPIRGLTYAA